MTTNVFIVDDDKKWMKGIRWFIDKQEDLIVVGVAHTADEVRSCVNVNFNVGVVLLDIMLGEETGTGMDLIKPIRSGWPTAKIVMMTGVDDGEVVMDCVREGAVDYVVKTEYHEFPPTIRAAVSGSEGMHHSAVRAIKRELAAQSRHSKVVLTPQQKRLLVMTNQGKSPRDISTELGIEPHSLRNYVSRINGKLGTTTREEAAAKARELGLLHPLDRL